MITVHLLNRTGMTHQSFTRANELALSRVLKGFRADVVVVFGEVKNMNLIIAIEMVAIKGEVVWR